MPQVFAAHRRGPLLARKARRAALLVVVLVCVVAAAFAGFGDVDAYVPDRDDPAIEYSTLPTHDPVSELNAEIAAGRARLNFDGGQGYLRSVLEALHVPVESQMAVFSKTSVQAFRINSQNPRTLFFNDSVVVGWVRGGFIELAAQDARQGVIFYVLDQNGASQPQFKRTDECMRCHDSNDALGVPGMIARSEFTGPDGVTVRQLGNYLSDHRSPLGERWGGWYVTGMTGAIRHMGNAVVTDPARPESMLANQTLNLQSLAGRFDTEAYLSPYSDVAALMVFEHQMHMMNLLTRLGWQTRYALYQSKPGNAQAAGSAENRPGLDKKDLDGTVRELVDYMLFIDEAPITAEIKGTSGFAEKFSAEGPQDKKGRSLRELDLTRRLMKYPCSYMIYSEAFEGLPAEARDLIYRQMWNVLSGELKGARYAHLSLGDRRAIVEILQDTKPGLPKYFGPVRR